MSKPYSHYIPATKYANDNLYGDGITSPLLSPRRAMDPYRDDRPNPYLTGKYVTRPLADDPMVPEYLPAEIHDNAPPPNYVMRPEYSQQLPYSQAMANFNIPNPNIYSDVQRGLQRGLEMGRYDFNRGMRDLNHIYGEFTGPRGIPRYLDQTGQLVDDTTQAATSLSRDVGSGLQMGSQAVTQLGGLGNRVLDSVEQYIPQVQGFARQMIDTVPTVVDNVVAPARELGNTVTTQAQGLADRLKRIYGNVAADPLGRQTATAQR
jgi:hypothetical protein